MNSKLLNKISFIILFIINFCSAQTLNTLHSGYYGQGIVRNPSGDYYISSGAYTMNVIYKLTSTGNISIFAGQPSNGNIDNTGTNASFYNPAGLAIDSSGNIYVADSGNNKIRKITPTGVVTTFAGNGTKSFANGIGTSASFSSPKGIAIDSSGNIYVADTDNNRIRKITPTGVVSTFAGNSSWGITDGTGADASFAQPSAMTIDSSGNLYVIDTGSNRIRKITPLGVVTTFAGSIQGFAEGTGTSAKFNFNGYGGITVDALGNLYVADTNNQRIRKISSSGIVSTIAGNGSAGFNDGSALSANLFNPVGIALDSSENNIIIGDIGSGKIRKFSNGTLSTVENLHDIKISISPNPVKNILNIHFDGKLKSVEIFNLQGQKIISSNQKQINTSSLSAGGYMVRIEDENSNIITRKVIKQ